jgi:hypothetical protein
MSQVYRGADRLLLGRRTAIATAMEGYLAAFLEET